MHFLFIIINEIIHRFWDSVASIKQKQQLKSPNVMSNGNEMASEDSDWSVSFSPPNLNGIRTTVTAEVTTCVVRIDRHFNWKGGMRLTNSHAISIPFEVAFWD
jgi:hypothetical protein